MIAVVVVIRGTVGGNHGGGFIKGCPLIRPAIPLGHITIGVVTVVIDHALVWQGTRGQLVAIAPGVMIITGIGFKGQVTLRIVVILPVIVIAVGVTKLPVYFVKFLSIARELEYEATLASTFYNLEGR